MNQRISWRRLAQSPASSSGRYSERSSRVKRSAQMRRSESEMKPIDPDRVYVLGHSMGGFGTWNAICQQPDRFAAAIPSAGGCDPRNDIRRIVDVPVWAFHGNADETVPVDLTRDAFRQLCELKANAKYTELGGVGHGQQHTFVYVGDDPARGFETQYASDRCDRTGDVWDWLFKQKRT